MSVPSHIPVPPQLKNLPQGVDLLYRWRNWTTWWDRFSFKVWNVIYPTRHDELQVGGDGKVWVHTAHREKPKLIDTVSPGTTHVLNTLNRELVIRLAGWKDSIRPESSEIHSFVHFLQRIANSSDLLRVIAGMKHKYREQINTRVNEKSDAELNKANIFWQTFYPICIRDLQFTKEEQDLIQHLSWEWKSNLASYPHYCRSWIVVSAIINMIYIPRK